MKKVEQRAGKLKRPIRDRTRSVNKRVIAIATASRYRGEAGEQKRQKEYRGLLRLTRQILNDTRRVIGEVEGRRKPVFVVKTQSCWKYRAWPRADSP
jgi:hypothetical protein